MNKTLINLINLNLIVFHVCFQPACTSQIVHVMSPESENKTTKKNVPSKLVSKTSDVEGDGRHM